jgi:hypothetical protein
MDQKGIHDFMREFIKCILEGQTSFDSYDENVSTNVSMIQTLYMESQGNVCTLKQVHQHDYMIICRRQTINCL